MTSSDISDNKRIAKNTGLLYVRMFIIMAVQLITARVVLDKLGFEDYGLYNVVGGVVGMLGFLNSTLGTSTSRYITYSLGVGNEEKLSTTFCTAYFTHVLLAILVFIILETGGLWFVYNKLVIDPLRMNAAFWVYQISLVTCFVSITQVPFTSEIIAHEKMSVYAYVSIIEAFAKLGILYIISVTSYDRLIVYALLLMFVQLIIALFYRLYSIRYFKECKLKWNFDKSLFAELAVFSGWNLTSNIAEMLRRQGVVVLINIFFSSDIVAAQAIGNQISSALMQFVNNIRTAVNPQIIKLHAAGECKLSRDLVIKSTIYLFDLLLLLGIPVILLMKPILELWLVDVPPYTVIFAQILIAEHIIGNFNGASYTSQLAAGKVRNNSIFAVIVDIFQFVITYFMLRFTGEVMWVPWLAMLNTTIWAFIIRPYLLMKDVNYTKNELIYCYKSCAKVVIVPLLVTVPLKMLLPDTFINYLILLGASVISVIISSLLFMDSNDRNKLLSYLKRRILKWV